MKAKRRIEEIVCCVGKASEALRNSARGGKRVSMVDVGADHGWVSYLAVARGYVDKVICSDISEKSLKKAQCLFESDKELLKKAEFRVGNGLQVLDLPTESVDICVIAGMGGAEMLKIIGERKCNAEGINIFILQLQHDELFVRALKAYTGLSIAYDKVVLDGKHVYRTIVAYDFVNCTRQNRYLCDKLKSVFDESAGASHSGLDIDFDIFGKNNLFDRSSGHVKALELLKELSNKIYSSITSGRKVASQDSDILEFLGALKKRIEYLDKILEYIQKESNTKNKENKSCRSKKS